MEFLKSRDFKRLDPSTTPLTSLKKLLGGRSDLWFANAEIVASNIKKLGRNASELEIVFEVSNPLLYIAFNKNTSDKVIERWQETYDQMVQEGSVWDILAKHNMSILYPQSLPKTYPREPK